MNPNEIFTYPVESKTKKQENLFRNTIVDFLKANAINKAEQ